MFTFFMDNRSINPYETFLNIYEIYTSYHSGIVITLLILIVYGSIGIPSCPIPFTNGYYYIKHGHQRVYDAWAEAIYSPIYTPNLPILFVCPTLTRFWISFLLSFYLSSIGRNKFMPRHSAR